MSDPSTRSWYFVTKTANVLGPLDEVKLADKLASKELTAKSLVWNGCAADKWTRLEDVRGLLPRLRRKSRGFTQLETVLKRISEIAIDQCSASLSFIVSYMGNSDEDDTNDADDYAESDTRKAHSYDPIGSSSADITDKASIMSIKTDELEEKRPVLSPRPLKSLMSERSEDKCSMMDDGGYINLETDTLALPHLITSKSPDPRSARDRLKLMPKYSEESLCLNDDSEFHFLSEDGHLFTPISPAVGSELMCDTDTMTVIHDASDNDDIITPSTIPTPIPAAHAAKRTPSSLSVPPTPPPIDGDYCPDFAEEKSDLKMATGFRMKQRSRKYRSAMKKKQRSRTNNSVTESELILSDESSLSLMLSNMSSSSTSSYAPTHLPLSSVASYSFGVPSSALETADFIDSEHPEYPESGVFHIVD